MAFGIKPVEPVEPAEKVQILYSCSGVVVSHLRQCPSWETKSPWEPWVAWMKTSISSFLFLSSNFEVSTDTYTHLCVSMIDNSILHTAQTIFQVNILVYVGV